MGGAWAGKSICASQALDIFRCPSGALSTASTHSDTSLPPLRRPALSTWTKPWGDDSKKARKRHSIPGGSLRIGLQNY